MPISAKFDKCSTNEGGPQKNVPCVFPFIFADRIYYKCTSDFDKDKKFWCSTKVDEEQHHISHGGNWGYCSNSNCRKLIESLIVELYLIFNSKLWTHEILKVFFWGFLLGLCLIFFTKINFQKYFCSKSYCLYK